MSAPNNSPAIQAEHILEALAEIYPDAAGNTGHLMEYALCDLRHLADRSELSFAIADREAHQTYLAEKAR